MADRGKVIKGLECHINERKISTDCEHCPYCEGDDACTSLDDLHSDALALLKAQEPIEARLHLCESCTKEYPECDATVDGIEFGSGVGNDNIIGCTAYVNRWKAQEPRVMTLDEVSRIQVETDVWIETHHPIYGCHIKAATAYATSNGDGNYLYVLGNPQSWHNYRFVDYEKNWRCWTSRPSDEQIRNTPLPKLHNG